MGNKAYMHKKKRIKHTSRVSGSRVHNTSADNICLHWHHSTWFRHSHLSLTLLFSSSPFLLHPLVANQPFFLSYSVNLHLSVLSRQVPTDSEMTAGYVRFGGKQVIHSTQVPALIVCFPSFALSISFCPQLSIDHTSFNFLPASYLHFLHFELYLSSLSVPIHILALHFSLLTLPRAPEPLLRK